MQLDHASPEQLRQWEQDLAGRRGELAQVHQRDELAEGGPVELQLGEAAYSAGDYTVALDAYKIFVKLVPKDSRAAQVKKAVAQLRKLGAKG